MDTSDHDDVELELLESWRGGDRAALEALLARLLPWLQGEVHRELVSQRFSVQDSMDFVQDAAIDVLTRGPKFVPQSGAQLRSLLRRVALNDIIDQRRRAARRGGHIESLQGSRGSFSGFGPRQRTSEGPSRIVELDENAKWIRLALQFLEPDERDLILASEVEELDWATIAREHALPSADAARIRCLRLKPKLANLLRRVRGGELPA